MTGDYRPLFNYYSKSWKFILISTLLLGSIGFIYVVNETPKYNVSIILTRKDLGAKASEEKNQFLFRVRSAQFPM